MMISIKFPIRSTTYPTPPTLILGHTLRTTTGRIYVSSVLTELSLTILNGCTPGDSQGHFTYEKGNIRSVIDYCDTSPSLTPLIQNFQIGYDQSLRTLKKDISNLNQKFRQNSSPHLGQQIQEKTKFYRKSFRYKARRFKQHLQGKIHNAADKSPKEWWALLKDLKSNAKWEDPDKYVQLDDLTAFFRNLYNDPSLSTDATTNLDLNFSSSDYFKENPPSQIFLLKMPLLNLRWLPIFSMGKATGLDNISNEMLKCIDFQGTSFLLKLFNKVYQTSQFPKNGRRPI